VSTRRAELEDQATRSAMSTQKQITANQKNAGQSTGPKTAGGKAAVALNALKHGLLAREVVLPTDGAGERAAFDEFADDVRDAFQPVGQLEDILVDKIVAGLWRLRRVTRVEAGLFAYRLYEGAVGRSSEEALQVSRNETWREDLVRRHLPALDRGAVENPALLGEALTAVRQVERRRDGPTPSLGRAFVADEGTFTTLTRYEAAIERGVYRALHELERLQRTRKGETVPPPSAGV